MARYCPKCGKEVSERANNCPNCGFQLQKRKFPQKKTKSKFKKFIGGLLLIAILLTGTIIFYEKNIVADDNQNIVPAENASENINSEETDISANQSTPITTSEVKEEKQATVETVEYEVFKDKVFGFSVEYNKKDKPPIPPKDENPKLAVRYTFEFSNGLFVAVGNEFATVGQHFNIESLMKQNKRLWYSSDDGFSNVKMQTLDDKSCEITFDRNGKHFIRKEFYGQVNGIEQCHYVVMGYMDSTDKKELEEAKHMYDSFKPGVA